ncbi:hypothetical protein ACLI4Z_15265 [Natrialbaceae archaeon A-arb3/5]
MNALRWIALAAVVICLVLAGCAGLVPGEESVESEQEANVSDVTTPPYEELSDASTVMDRHDEQIRSVASVTRHLDARMAYSTADDDDEVEQANRTVRSDQTTAPPRRHVALDDGTEHWLSPNRNLTKEAAGHYSPGPRNVDFVEIDAETIEAFEFDGPEPVERDGETRYRYRANGTDALSEDAHDSFEGDTVERASATLVLRGDGLITEVETTLAVTADDEDERYEQTRSIRYTDLGTTDVNRPDWYDEAANSVPPLPGETVTETREISSPNATLSVTGDAGDISGQYAVHPTMESTDSFSADELEAAQVSCLTRIYLPESYDDAELTIEYDDAHVPGDDTDGLELTRYVARTGSFTTLGEVDPEMNTATGSIDGDGYYFVKHEPTFETAFVNRETPSETAPPSECE